MNINSVKINLKNAFQDDFKGGFRKFKDIISYDSDLFNEYVKLQVRYKRYLKRVHENTLNYDESNIQLNKISSAFLHLVDEIKDKDLSVDQNYNVEKSNHVKNDINNTEFIEKMNWVKNKIQQHSKATVATFVGDLRYREPILRLRRSEINFLDLNNVYSTTTYLGWNLDYEQTKVFLSRKSMYKVIYKEKEDFYNFSSTVFPIAKSESDSISQFESKFELDLNDISEIWFEESGQKDYYGENSIGELVIKSFKNHKSILNKNVVTTNGTPYVLNSLRIYLDNTRIGVEVESKFDKILNFVKNIK